uniref:Glucomannan 4-beta-mannosyltransferase 1 n=1 Tax=Elaeis guineensis var. tenera TaxID=51953 RepID=A0A6I9QL20_ELAGV|nr:glucomannan 4-beta-mannosyltransferase 1 [Elaeis guineensis]
MSMDYHFKVEQESGSSTCAFFGYNGTAGVWRIRAINDAGGWKDRTTVEDMDLAVRAGLGGWKFVYVGNVKVKSELPSTFKAYRYQQHRWACGPAVLFRKMFWEIVKAKKVSIWKKLHVIYNFFLARRIISHFVTFSFYCVVIPLSVFFPEVEIPKWGMIYVPTTITLLNSVGTPSSFHLIIFWVLFENVMSLHRCKAVLIGLLEAGRANEWIVTEKLGDMLKTKSNISVTQKIRFKFWDRFHLLELGLAVFLMICACYDCIYRQDYFFIYIFPQSITFFIMGFGYVGTIIPSQK